MEEQARAADMFSVQERAAIMRAVKGTGTTAENLFKKLLEELSIDYRPQADELPGRPDFVDDSLRITFFVDGDFWHGRWWFEQGRAPVANRDYWISKFEKNHCRDIRAVRRLRRQGWSVIRIWESDLRRDPEAVLALLRARVVRRKREVRKRLAPA